MILSLAVALVSATIALAQTAESPAPPSPVRQSLIAALGPKADGVGPEFSLRALVEGMTPEMRSDAREKLDALDKAVLPSSALTDLSHAYALLGAHGSAAKAGMTLQEREPKGTQGLVLAASAKLDQGDYVTSAALAEQALKINPGDKNARYFYETAKGRGAPKSGTDAPKHTLATPTTTRQTDDRPLRPGYRAGPTIAPPEVMDESPSPPSRDGRPWVPYAVGAALTLFGIGLSIKHGLEQTAEAVDQTQEKALDGASNLYFKGKDFVQENPKTTIGVGVVAVAIAGWLILPTLGLGGGGLALATAGGGSVPVAATATSVGAMKTAAIGSVVAAPLLMAGDAGQSKTKKDESRQEATPQSVQGESSSIKKPSASDPKLNNIIDDLFQPGDTLPGGTAGAVRNEILTGRPTGFRRPTFHLKKAEYSIRGLDNVLKQKTLSPADRATAEAIRQDLINALNTDLVILP